MGMQFVLKKVRFCWRILLSRWANSRTSIHCRSRFSKLNRKPKNGMNTVTSLNRCPYTSSAYKCSLCKATTQLIMLIVKKRVKRVTLRVKILSKRLEPSKTT